MIISRDFGLDLVAVEMSQVARGDSGGLTCVIRSSCGLASLSMLEFETPVVESTAKPRSPFILEFYQN